jgi:dipeptidyl aminopeptidase/acylaminoacyl peptidase
MKKLLQRAAALLLGACLAGLAPAADPGADPGAPPAPPEDPLLAPFLQPASYASLHLSPDGKHLAAILFNGTNTAVSLIDADTLGTAATVQPIAVARSKFVAHVRNPQQVQWIANDLVAVNFNDGAALYDLAGRRVRDLFWAFRAQLRDAAGRPTDWVLVQREFDNPNSLSRMNVRTGENYSVDIDLRGRLVNWQVDELGRVRVAQTLDTAFWTDTTRIATWTRDGDEAAWVKIDERSILDDPFVPIMFTARPGHLAVQARNGTDRLAIWDFDIQRKAIVDLMAGHPTEDIVGAAPSADKTEFQRVTTDGLKPASVWFEPHLARLQATLDASLPNHVNLIQPSRSPRVLVFSYSDVDPGRWYLFDLAAKSLKEIAARLPAIDPGRMLPMRTLSYPSFDGLMVPAYLTLPGKPAGPVPTVILIHGGPQARDRWIFDKEVQAFAAHGYAVFQPQFRGSTGFGKKFEQAGYGQWGQAMQDDITAGVHWLVDQKIADPARICIVGTSYGGYAALWGLAKTPGLYRCGVSTAGVADIERMLHSDSDAARNAIGREIFASHIGDPRLMAATWDSVSPVKHADRIVAPLLLVHGALDERVPISQGRLMLERMRKLHKDVQWLEFPDERHGVAHVDNQRRWYAAMLALFERTIGKGVPPFAPADPAAAGGPQAGSGPGSASPSASPSASGSASGSASSFGSGSEPAEVPASRPPAPTALNAARADAAGRDRGRPVAGAAERALP